MMCRVIGASMVQGGRMRSCMCDVLASPSLLSLPRPIHPVQPERRIQKGGPQGVHAYVV